MIVKAKDRQNFFDIAVINTGSAEDAYTIAYASGKSISDHIAESDSIVVVAVTNQRVVKFYQSQKHLPATCDLVPDGIFDNTFDNTFE